MHVTVIGDQAATGLSIVIDERSGYTVRNLRGTTLG
jgi:hypothetical protein